MLTAYSDEELVRRAVKAGVYAYLVKPFRATDLMPAIETAIARYDEMQALREETTTPGRRARSAESDRASEGPADGTRGTDGS